MNIYIFFFNNNFSSTGYKLELYTYILLLVYLKLYTTVFIISRLRYSRAQ